MNDTKNVVIELFRRLGTFDADFVGELFADVIDWNVPAVDGLPWTGRRTRKDQVPEYFKTMWPHFFTERSVVVPDILLVDGDDAVQLGTFSHVTRPGERPFTAFAMRLTVTGGRVVRMHLYEDSHTVALAFAGDFGVSMD